MNTEYKVYPTIVGIPRVHWASSLNNFNNKYSDSFFLELETVAKDVISGTNKYNYLILCGSPGSGKTHFLVGVYKSLLDRLGYLHGDGALFIMFSAWMSEMIMRFGDGTSSSMRSLLVEYLQARYLFLDDVTSTERVFKTETMEYAVFRDVLIERWDNAKFLGFTSNFTKAELVRFITASLGAYVASRVLSSAKILEFPRKDFRFGEAGK